jgi:hypothetical protein
MLTMISFTEVILMVRPEYILSDTTNTKGSQYCVFIGVMLCSAFANPLNLHFVHGLGKLVDPIVNMFYSHLGLTLVGSLLNNL